MTKVLRDKIITLLGAGFLGYYLSISLFHSLIRNNLVKILPPINDRHLPDIYVDIMGAAILAIFAYLLFNVVLEKRSFKLYKKSYLIAISLLIIAPLVIAGIFRVHAVSWVQKAEGTAPKEITIRTDREGDSLMFADGTSSASGVAKSIFFTEPLLDDFGKGIREMELKQVVSSEEQRMDSSYLTMWIRYEIDGKWYSKILSYGQGLFEEHVAGGRIAYYANPELENLLKKAFGESADINNYDRARVINSVTINRENGAEERKRFLTPEDFQILVDSLRPENLIHQDTEGVKRIKEALKEWVPQEETNIYGIELWQKGSDENMGQNFMVYDKRTRTLMFECAYYQVDLDDIVA
ncbi:hypothetical protein Desor_2699 [Desulfosporosinus orientis DSM 765]|uniref:Uncharacterized protein n=1 Tax=Desulfosporosinus orientis (strain ATCC 19365 / DSM 765 / NCIMB 8382 / VKM B-1628 / Singapore I) TaxID=768706 RepID=G7WBB4_DESOD|nr:hypothetical protein [Desulfosporosinus orientis]AET68243.1 hypothetical protein Desor_2699 [Desulfosporosinus orientis DSM 765]